MAKVADAGFGYIEGRQIKKAKDAEAAQLRRAAIQREAAGTQAAYEQRKVGERVQSDAIAVMAASGGVVDSDIVADLKSTTDYNVLSELFAGKTESAALRLKAKMSKFEGSHAKRMATAKLATAIVIESAKAASGAGGAAAGGPITSAAGTAAGANAGVDIYNDGSNYAGYS